MVSQFYPNEFCMHLLKYIILVFSTAILLFSCQSEKFNDNPYVKLKFSQDTVSFDTIFTTIGTPTKLLKIYNPTSQSVKISKVFLAGGGQSAFKLNIDGSEINPVENIEIYPHDSLFLFVIAKIEQNFTDAPLFVHDSIVFITNGNRQHVELSAWGQDIHLLNNSTLKSQTWTSDKPYLIYGHVVVDSSQTLNIDEGTLVYLHKNASLIVKGTLNVHGSRAHPVIFRGDRTEHWYDSIPGQWGTISIEVPSKENVIDYAVIKNGTTGISIGKYNDKAHPSLTLSNTIIENMSYSGIISMGASFLAANTVIADCANYLAALLSGGTYRFYHCTLVNYWNSFSLRSSPSILLTNTFTMPVLGQSSGRSAPISYAGDLDVLFANSVIYGFLPNEVNFIFDPHAGMANFVFDHCLLRLNPGKTDNNNFKVDTSDVRCFKNVLFNQDPMFKSVANMDFNPDVFSILRNKGKLEYGQLYPFDIMGRSRTEDSAPDLGAYEGE